MVYTAITFAPVQGFIEKSRKLRDLYGSSFILSFLAKAVCDAAKGELGEEAVVSPALLDVARGTPNQIVIQGNFAKGKARAALDSAWHRVVDACRQWIEQQVEANYTWKREWHAWQNHAWEFFWGQGDSVTAARQAVNRQKHARDWTGINWMGESSTLSGTDAIAWPGMGRPRDPKAIALRADDEEIQQFYQQLRDHPSLGAAFADEREQLSIPELVKRLVTYPVLAKPLGLPQRELPLSFSQTSQNQAPKFWFQGDGDRIGKYLQSLKDQDEAEALRKFSTAMMHWGEDFLKPAVENQKIGAGETGRIIYAGGDDFLGVIYNADDDPKQFSPYRCLRWFCDFPEIWKQHKQNITVSVGAVLASPQVPQRDVLQHCREAEKSAKQRGRDRLALRVLFRSGNHIEWVCPWGFLKDVMAGYCDRSGIQGAKANWGHFLSDVAALEARHGMGASATDSAVALALFGLYFGAERQHILETQAWGEAGIVHANCPASQRPQALNQWVSNLAKVGFQLCSNT
ncbi:MAG: type III-B CRISPR-associated protein Cas10/Cmr2 [Pseudanabaenaceae cyanobacterium]